MVRRDVFVSVSIRGLGRGGLRVPSSWVMWSLKKGQALSQMPVAHACNTSYAGGRDQEDCGLKPGWANSS
jgi:hypothetical protein